MTRVLVLGASFAGLGAARELGRLLPGKNVRITVVDQTDRFLFRPALPWIVFGERPLHKVVVPLSPLLEGWGVEFVRDTVEGVDPRSGQVMGRRGRYAYDFLLIALGATSPPDVPPPLARRGHHPLWATDALRLQDAVKAFPGGGAVMNLAPYSPLACPAYELVFHLDRFLRARGLRPRARIAMVSYEERPFAAAGPAVSRLIARWLGERGIEFYPSCCVADAAADHVVLSDGRILPASLIMYIPAFRGSPAVRAVPALADAEGFVLVDRSLRAAAYPNTFAAGDIVALPGPKNGRMAEIQGRVAARNIAALLGGGHTVPYSSHLACLLDVGAHRGVAALRKPNPGQGRTRTFIVWPGWLPHLAKMGVERYSMGVKFAPRGREDYGTRRTGTRPGAATSTPPR